MQQEDPELIYQFHVPGIMCGACTGSISHVLTNLSGLPSYQQRVDLNDRTAYVTVKQSLTPEQVLMFANTIEAAGFSDVTFTLPHQRRVVQTPEKVFPNVMKALLGCVAGAVSLYLTMCGMSIPLWLMNMVDVIGIFLTSYLGWETFQKAKIALANNKLNMHVLFSLNTLIVLVVSMIAWFNPTFPRLMYTALFLFGFKNVGDVVEKRIKHHLVKDVSYRERAAREVEKLVDGMWQRVTVDKVNRGDLIRLKPGMINPCDGVCRSDKAAVYQEILNGDRNKRVPKLLEEKILAGMRVTEDMNYLRIEVTHKESESYLARKDAKLLAAQMKRPQVERDMESVMNYFIPGVVGVALGAVLLGFGWMTALSIMVGICPCVVFTILPLFLSACMQKAADLLAMFTSTSAIIAASRVTVAVFDRNLTLTTGDLSVANHHIINKHISKREFYDIVHALEQASQHPFAKPIADYVKRKQKYFKYSVTPGSVQQGAGVKAEINSKNYLIGNQNFLRTQGVMIPDDMAEKIVRYSEQGYHVSLVAEGANLLGYFLVNDPIREGAEYTIKQFQQQGIEVWMCTGSDEVTALATAKKVGIPEKQIWANCPDPETKAKFVRQLQAQGYKVAMVGDGANDDQAMAEPECVGILIKSSESDESVEQAASIVVEGETLYPVLSAITVAKQMQRNIWLSLAITGAYNVMVITMACCGMMSPLQCMAMMFAQSISVRLLTEIYKRLPVPHRTGPATAETPSWQSSFKRMLGDYLAPTDKTEHTLMAAARPSVTRLSVAACVRARKRSLGYRLQEEKVARLISPIH